MKEKSLSYFRIKTEYIAEEPNGALSKKKIEELVLATCYAEAEALAYELTSSYGRSQFGSVNYEIIKTKISDVLYNDILAQEPEPIKGMSCNYFEEADTSAVGLYAVKVVFISIDEKTAKEKQSADMFYVPASSNADATARINTHLKGTTMDYVIRDTKFDKAEAIYWPLDVHKSKVDSFSLG